MNQSTSRNIFSVAFHLLFLVFFLVLGVSAAKHTSNEIPLLYVLFGGLGVFVVFMASIHTSQSNQRVRKYPGWIAFLSAIGIPAILCLMFSSIFFVAAEEGNHYLLMDVEAGTAFKIHLILLAYSILCLFAFWSRYTVKDKSLIVINEKIFYPGEAFRQWPVLRKEESILEQEHALPPFPVTLKCRDGEFAVGVKTKIYLCIETAKKEGNRSLNVNQLNEQSQKRIAQELMERAAPLTYGEFLKQQPRGPLMEVAGFTIFWPGKAKFTSTVSN